MTACLGQAKPEIGQVNLETTCQNGQVRYQCLLHHVLYKLGQVNFTFGQVKLDIYDTEGVRGGQERKGERVHVKLKG